MRFGTGAFLAVNEATFKIINICNNNPKTPYVPTHVWYPPKQTP